MAAGILRVATVWLVHGHTHMQVQNLWLGSHVTVLFCAMVKLHL